MDNITRIRKEYSLEKLHETTAHPDPMKQFSAWWQQAVKAGIDEVNAMTLSTASLDALPSARVVLLKGFDDRGFIFFTNYNSYKAKQLQENPKACLSFFWKELERQVRITGIVQKISSKESDDYFDSRPEGSRIGAIVSPQSSVIESREWLDNEFRKKENELKGSEIKRPSHWGGYLVKPVIFEFWQGRASRLHDRLQYTLQDNGQWIMERLAP